LRNNTALRAVRYYLAIVILLGAHGTALAQVDSSPGEKSFVWSVRGGSNTVYILGSLHLLSKESYPLGKAYEDAFQNSEVVVFEVDPGELEKPETIRMVLSKAALENGKTLEETLSPETYRLAKEKLKDAGVDIQMFSKTKPWFVAVTVAVLKLSQMGFQPEEGVDRYFYNKAKEGQKGVMGLETAEFQIDLIASIGGDTEDDILLHTLKDLDVMEAEMKSLVGSWKRGDVGEFKKVILKSYWEYPRVYDELIAARNKNWLPHIEKYLGGDKNYLVVVGAGHLVGPDGLINMLTQKGYKVEQM
jgi:uncharacterized protein YbaP (TraB family)